MAAGNASSFLHVEKSEIDFPDGFNAYGPEVYARAAANLMRLQTQGALIREAEDRFYVYRQKMGKHVQRGIVGCFHIEEYEQGIVRKHEKTREDKERDRTRHVDVLSANAGPVFLAYRDEPAIDALVRDAECGTPIFDFVAADGIEHAGWCMSATAEVEGAFARVPVCYIADGHHRAAAAANVGRRRREANARHTGMEGYNWVLAVIFPASQLQILPINRCVLDLNGLTRDEFLRELSREFTVSSDAVAVPELPGHASMYLAGRWYQLAWKMPQADPVARLDVSVLQDRLLGPVLGIRDPRRDERIEFVGGIRGTGELEARVNSGRSTVAFSMAPVTMEQVIAIADANGIMPPKSTWFEPKLRSGLFVHTF